MECPSCGQRNVAGAEYCAACGAAVTSAQSLPDPPVPPPLPEFAIQPQLFELPPQPTRHPQPAGGTITATAHLPGWQPLLGPIDRESFFDAQRRNRRAVWRQTAVCALAAAVVGIPISLILTPILFAFVIVTTKLVDLVVAVPMTVWDRYDAVLSLPIKVFDAIAGSSSASTGTTHSGVSVSQILVAAVVWFLPGMLAMLVIWPAIGRLLRTAGTAGMLTAIGARPPRPGDLEEQQLVNVVQELALAAGIPTPRVMLLSTSAANAAAVGSSRENAVIVVGRRVLDELDRDETQGVLSHLVASIGNGDLRVATSILAMYQTFGVAAALIKSPISGDARRTVGRVLRFAVGRRTSATRAVEAEAVARLLTHAATDIDAHDDMGAALARVEAGPAPKRGLPPIVLFYVPGALLVFYLGAYMAGWSADTRRLGMAAIVGVGVLVILYQLRFMLSLIPRVLAATRAFIILPYYLAVMLPQLLLVLLVPYVLEPMLAFAWRARRYLADATAVQLTRNPDWLAGGLAHLTQRGGGVPSGRWAAPLFIIGGTLAPEHGLSGAERAELAMLEQALATQPATSDLYRQQVARQQELMGAARAAEQRHAADHEPSRMFGGGSGRGSVSYFPPVYTRLVRLRRMGSRVDPGRPERSLLRAGLARSLRHPMELVALAFFTTVTLLGIAAGIVLAALSLAFALLVMATVYTLLQVLMPA
jgi:Zn-dependent protease with chaperone function